MRVILFGFAAELEAQAPQRITTCIANPSGAPIAAATVSLPGTLLVAESNAQGCAQIALATTQRRLRILRMGYRPVEADIPSQSFTPQDTLHVMMQPSVVELAPTLVVGSSSAPLVTTISPETLRQLPALGERDVFRALPFVPGVSQPNDVLSRAHLAGGASDEHGITLDGHPLQAPFHINQVFGAVNPSALDRVDVLIHHLPASRQDRLSGSIDLTPRRLDGSPVREVQLSVLSAAVTVLEPKALAIADVMLSARSSYLDGLLRALHVSDGNGGDDARVPSFRDAMLTVRRVWTSGWQVDALGFHTEDRWFKSSGLSTAAPPRWGESLLGLRASYLRGSWRADARVSHDRAFAKSQRVTAVADTLVVSRPGDIALDQRWLSASTSLAFQRATWRLHGGLSYERRTHDNRWSGPDVDDLLSPVIPSPSAYVATQALTGAHLEATRVASFATVALGARATRVDGNSELAPRVVLTAPLSRSLDVSISANRRLQYDAIATEPREGSITQPVFFLATPRIADVGAISTTWRPRHANHARRLQATATLYARRQRNVPVLVTEGLAPQLGTLTANAAASRLIEPQFARTSGTVAGGSVAMDYATESGWLVQSSYTRQRVRDKRNGTLRPVPWDAPHQLVGIVGMPFGGRFQATIAQQVRSGTPVTPIQYRLLTPTPFGTYAWRVIPGEPYSARRPNYVRTDLGLQGTWNALGRRWIASAQIINAFSRTNGLDATAASLIMCRGAQATCEYGGATRRSLPVLPSIGLEVRW